MDNPSPESANPRFGIEPNRDAVRIAEQIRSLVAARPAVLLFASMEDDLETGSLASQVGARLSLHGEGKALLVEWGDSKDLEGEGQVVSIDSLGAASFSALARPLAGGLDGFVVASGEATENQLLSLKAFLKEAKDRYAYVLLSGVPVRGREIFTTVALADFCVVSLRRGESSKVEFGQFVGECKLVAPTPVGAVLVG